MVGALTQSYIKNGGSKNRPHKTLIASTHMQMAYSEYLLEACFNLQNF